MKRSLNLNRALLSVALPIVLFGAIITIINSGLITTEPSLGLAITIDLLLVIPLVYFLLIRKTAIPKTTVMPVLVLGLVIGTVWLPKNEQFYIELFKAWVLPVVEVIVVTFVVFKVRKVLKTYKRQKSDVFDFYIVLQNTCAEFLPKRLVMPFVTEVAVFYYSFVNWKSLKLNENEFTYHKDSGLRAVLCVFIFLILIETAALHILLVKWNVIVDWILFGLSFYTALQVLGVCKVII